MNFIKNEKNRDFFVTQLMYNSDEDNRYDLFRIILIQQTKRRANQNYYQIPHLNNFCWNIRFRNVSFFFVNKTHSRLIIILLLLFVGSTDSIYTQNEKKNPTYDLHSQFIENHITIFIEHQKDNGWAHIICKFILFRRNENNNKSSGEKNTILRLFF